jgi:hypothetical protein
MGRQLLFYACREDLLGVLSEVEHAYPVKYVRTGFYATADPDVVTTATAIEGVGTVPSGEQLFVPRYLVLPQETRVGSRYCPEKRDPLKYDVIAGRNPQSFLLVPGGLFQDSFLVGGLCETVSDHPVSSDLYELLREPIRRQFRRVARRTYVGQGAAAFARGGGKLGMSVACPEQFHS